MKKIISGKVYDTETATFLADRTHSSTSQFDYIIEQLYRKRTGEYFLYGEGGSLSKYAESAGQNAWIGGKKIIPLSYEAARDWAEEHLEADDYEEIFGKIEEDESEVYITVEVNRFLYEKIKRKAQMEDKTVKEIINAAFEEFLKDK